MKGKFIKKIQLIVPILLFFGLLFLFLYFFSQIKNNIKIINESNILLQKEIIIQKDIKNLNNSFESIKNDQLLLEKHFAKSSDIVPFLNKIEIMAQSVGVKGEVSFMEIAKDNTGLILEMKNTGSFSDLYKFIMLIENSPYELEINSIDLQNINDKTIKGNEWEAILKIKLISFIK